MKNQHAIQKIHTNESQEQPMKTQPKFRIKGNSTLKYLFWGMVGALSFSAFSVHKEIQANHVENPLQPFAAQVSNDKPPVHPLFPTNKE
ncbi:MAG: hypothetical protein KME29_31285 [Calothrix sp. FI2-JRJ7]|nr:hypothetical protein [Calothrix sp. FI2-JRJ7]